MKTTVARLAAALPLALLAACGGRTAVGVYDVDKAALKQVMLAALPEQARGQKEAIDQVDAMVAGTSTTIELKADGTAAMQMKMTLMGRTMDDAAAGTWKLDGTKLSITMQKDGKDDTKVADFDGTSFAVVDTAGGQPMTMTFRRR